MQKIAIHSVPRSGSTWLGNIFNSHPRLAFKFQPLFSYAFRDYLTPYSNVNEINTFFEEIVNSQDAFLNQHDAVSKNAVPVFVKENRLTHCCYKEVRYHYILDNMLSKTDDVKLILLIRNPLATLYSWYKAPKEFKKHLGWNFHEEWLDAPKKNSDKEEEFNGYNKWKEASLLFLRLKEKYPKNIYLLDYQDLLENPVNITKQLFSFTDLSYEKQTDAFLNISTSINHSDAYSVFKIKEKDNDWKYLPRNIIDYIINDLKNTELEKFLYE
ncbi:sulfotransferase domain-containing protein [Mariniflexile sp. HNIBRBA6329]|uniref:sulfotransferase domain-containing protein n=1 Tax=Mariniflexile sp. HNIBRBA6329 TaxID=3373088 RepID=UPI003745C6D2